MRWPYQAPGAAGVSQQALLGVIDTLRYSGVVMASLCHPHAAAAKLARAALIASAKGIDAPVLQARLATPCLAALDDQASRTPAAAQTIYREMFTMAERAQGSTTSQEIAETAARLAADAKNPKVAAAIRAHQDAVVALARLYRARDDLAHGQNGKA